MEGVERSDCNFLGEPAKLDSLSTNQITPSLLKTSHTHLTGVRSVYHNIINEHADFHATIHAALGINPHHDLVDASRPVPITDGGIPIAKLFA